MKVSTPCNTKKSSIEFVVVDKDELTLLLGSKALRQMGLVAVSTNKFVCMNVAVDSSSESKSILNEFADVFDVSLGSFPGRVHLETDPSVRPIILPTRRVQHAIKAQF